MKIIQKAGKFYTSMIMKNIGLFIFIGFLSVLFHSDGWCPNDSIYDISQLAYRYILPCMIAFEGGNKISGHYGGLIGVMALSGILTRNPEIGIFGAMISAPLGGFLWEKEQNFLEKDCFAGTKMLVRNFTLGITGGVLAAAEYYLLAEVTEVIAAAMEKGITWLLVHNAIAILSVLIEPAKVFFLNNLLNHGILVPIGISQAERAGNSLLFLLETNPGPGFGVLLAMLIFHRKEKKQCLNLAAAGFTELIGGIHEVYFPIVLADLGLLIPLILGGISGSVWFSSFQCAAASVISPGSILTILLLSGKGKILVTLGGIVISAAVSGAGTFLYLYIKHIKIQQKTEQKKENRSDVERNMTEIDKKSDIRSDIQEDTKSGTKIDYGIVHKIGFVCDGGMGSSAMGAALFRRALRERNITQVEVGVYAADMVEKDVDLIVCQKDFYLANERLHNQKCHVISGFTQKEEYIELIRVLGLGI